MMAVTVAARESTRCLACCRSTLTHVRAMISLQFPFTPTSYLRRRQRTPAASTSALTSLAASSAHEERHAAARWWAPPLAIVLPLPDPPPVACPRRSHAPWVW